MNCQEFEEIVAELAADELLPARTRIAALTHATACEQCSARLEAEQALGRHLLALADVTRGEQAPARLKQSLMAEFEARQTNAAAAPNVVRLPVKRRQWTWPLAVAAAAAIIVALAVSLWRHAAAPGPSMLEARATPSPVMRPNASAPLPEQIAPRDDTAPQLANRTPNGKTLKPKRVVPQRRQQFNQFDGSNQASPSDLAANYIPLSYAAGSATPEESLVVRVDVPRTTLIAMGLPLSAERGNEMVKADLKVGLDGVPLAIRLVRQ